MKKWLQGLFVIIVGIGIFGCDSAKDSADSTESVLKDSDIGLRRVDLANEKDVKLLEYSYADKAAGESELIDRAFENAPPMIPHSVEDMLPITQDSNACLTCHDPAVAKDMGAIPTPSSHTHDFIDGKAKDLGKVAPSRFNCVQCHTPQSNAPALINNTFSPDFRDSASKNSSNLLETINEGVN